MKQVECHSLSLIFRLKCFKLVGCPLYSWATWKQRTDLITSTSSGILSFTFAILPNHANK